LANIIYGPVALISSTEEKKYPETKLLLADTVGRLFPIAWKTIIEEVKDRFRDVQVIDLANIYEFRLN